MPRTPPVAHDFTQQDLSCHFSDPLPPSLDGRPWQDGGFAVMTPRTFSTIPVSLLVWVTVDALPMHEGGS